MESNRRLYERKELHLAVEVITEDNIFTGLTSDISKGGMKIDINGPVYETAAVQIGVFKIVEGIEDSGQPIGIDGLVAWSRSMDPGHFSLGIKFVNLGTEEESYLADLVGEQNKLF